MAAPRTWLRTLAMFLAIAGTLICNNNVVMVSAQCGGSVPDLIAQCSEYVQKTGPTIPPSAACCAVVRTFDITCACKLITKEIANLVSVPKAIFVARSCGVNLQSGTKCGAIVVPGRR